MRTVLAVAAVLVGSGLYLEGRSRARHGWHRLSYRWLTGKAWHGQPVSGDVWAWPGPWFWQLHRAKRAVLRICVSACACLAVYGWLTDRRQAVILILGAVLVSLAACAALLIVALVSYRHRRRWVRPLHKRTHALIGVAKAGPMRHLTVARDRSHAQIRLPQDWSADASGRSELVRVTAETLGIEAPEASWRLAGPAPMLTLTTSQPPPVKVTLPDVRGHIEAARPDEWVWGLGKRKTVIRTSLSGDSPHAGLSMGSGAGKSVTARLLLAQSLFHGAIGLILDVKMISHQWARDLPNVVIVRRPHEIHAALLWLGREADRRNEVALAGADMEGNVHATVGERLIIVCEELNATTARLRAYWREVRAADTGLPARSPALEALDAVSFMGRQVKMNILYIGQRLSVKASGGDGDARENIGVIGFGRYTPSNWKMLAGDHVMPPKSLTPGRLQVVTDKVRECQAAFLPAKEARELATSGTVALLPAGMPGAVVSRPAQAPIPGPDLGVVRETRTLVTLVQAVDERIVNRSIGALRHGRGFRCRRGSTGWRSCMTRLSWRCGTGHERRSRFARRRRPSGGRRGGVVGGAGVG
jgi:hypothetical protein